MDRELTPKQQTSEAIRQAEAILIMTGQHPNIDQVASTVALSSLLRKFGKKVTVVISDDVPVACKFLPMNMVERTLGGLRDFILQVGLDHAEVDKLKYTIEDNKLNVHVTPFSGGFHPRDVSFSYGEYHFDLVIVVGVASYGRIDKVYAQNAELLRKIPMVNIDFHRINEQYGAINLIEPTAASLGEMLIALSESLQAGLIDEEIATIMLTGIMAATDRFTATHTTSKTMTVAAQMMAMGADQQKIVKNLFKAERTERDKKAAASKKSEKDKLPAQAQSVPQPQSAQPQAAAKPEPVAHIIEQAPVQAPVQIQPVTPQAPVQAPLPVAGQPAIPQAQPAPVDQPEVIPSAQPTPQASSDVHQSMQAAPPVATVQPEPTPVDTQPPAPQSPVVNTPAPSAPAAPSSFQQKIEPETPTTDEESDTESDSIMEELLPPQHIELSDPDQAGEPEPLINDTSDRQPKPQAPKKPSNPTNNPIFAQRLDEFEI